MSYRDESEALRARVGQLEDELARKEDTIARLRGEKAGLEAATRESAMLGGPSGVTMERELPFEIDDAGYEAIAQVVRSRLGVEVSQVGRTLSTPRDVFSLRREAGATVVRVRGDWEGLKGRPIAIGAISAMFTAFPLLGVGLDVATSTGNPWPVALVALAPILGGAAGWLGRRHAKRSAEKLLETHRGVMETVLAIAEEHAIAKAPAQVRVEDEKEEEEEIEVVRGAEAERAHRR